MVGTRIWCEDKDLFVDLFIRTNFTIVHNWNNGIQYIVGLASLRN